MLTLEDLKTKLDSDQYAAVTAPMGKILCVANAGSGKTRVLTHRIAWQIAQGESEESFIMLTFTVKAAAEMSKRIAKLLETKSLKLVSGTFHSVAWKFLCKYRSYLNLPKDLTIIDDVDSLELFGLCREYYCAFHEGDRKNMPDKHQISSIYSFCRNTGKDVEDYAYSVCNLSPSHVDMVLGVIEEYERRKKKDHAVDFDDLLLLFDRLLSVPEFQRICHESFPNIFVDEFQDINLVQANIIQKLTSERLTAVGDDAQCIYSWRGSEISFIRNFQRDYPGSTIYPIRNNYRSTEPVVNLALSVINDSPDYTNTPKQMKAVIPSKIKPVYREYRGYRANRTMTDDIVQRIEELHQSGTPYDEIAVLFRMNFLPKQLEAKLGAANIPVSMECGYPFYSRAHIRPVLHYLKFMLNPANELSFWSLVSLLEGVGKKTAQKMFEAFTGYKCDIQMLGELSVPKKTSLEFQHLIAGIQVGYERVQHPVTNKKTSVPQQLLEIFYNWFLKEYMERTYGDHGADKELKQRLSDYRLLYEAMENKTLEEFLSNVSLESQRDEATEGAVRLLTVHKAKGLEWDSVIIPYLNDQVFPISYDTMEEERRLLYVAMTRARKTLDLYSCRGVIETWPRFAGDRSPLVLGSAWGKMQIEKPVQTRR